MAKQLIHSEQNFIIPNTGLKEYIVGLASRYGVTYTKTPTDQLAEVITRLSGDDVEMDDAQYLLLALKRAGVMSTKQMGFILVNYLREKFNVRSV